MKVKCVKVGDICDFIGGSQPPKSEFINEPKFGYIRLIQTRDFKTDTFATYIPDNSVKKFCNKEDIMIGRYGPPIFQICRGMEGAYNVALLKANPKDGINREFLYYFLKQKSIFEFVDKLSARTGGQTGVDLVSLNKYPVRIPIEIEDQKKLISILYVVDKKIKINNKINTELEKMAKTIYDYWFVQFDFPDKNGKPYKSSGGKMVWNKELKQNIPEGWTAGTLSDLGEIIGGSTPTRDNKENFDLNGTPWITPKDLSVNAGCKYITKGEFCVSKEGIKSASLKLLPKGSVLMSSRAPVGYMAIAREPVTTNQGFKSFVPKSGYSTPFIFYAIKNVMPQIINNASGSTFKEISGNTLKMIKIYLPPKEVIQHYTETSNSIFDRQNILELENQKLSKLRDWLLPMLMNGQVKVL